jgi:cardiolipin synthase
VISLNLPNALSFARIAAVPVLLVCLHRDEPQAALWLFVGAAVTDVLDGVLARALGQQTTLGGWLDPLADKLLVFSVFLALTLGERPVFSPGFTALCLGRDAFVVAGIVLLRWMGREVVIAPFRLSKYATFFQTAVLAAALGYRAFGEPAGAAPYLRATMALAASFALVSIGQYLWRGTQIVRGVAR